MLSSKLTSFPSHPLDFFLLLCDFYNVDIVDFLSFLCFYLQLALSIKPNFSQSLNNLGVVYTVQVCVLTHD